MRIIRTHEVDPLTLDEWTTENVYNGLDVAVTAEICDTLLQELDNQTQSTYEFSKSLQGPVLDMRLRGCRVDTARRMEVIDELTDLVDHYETLLNRLVFQGIGMSVFNWRSNKDLQKLFYNELGLPVVRRGRGPTCDRGARESLEIYPTATILCRLINTLTDLGDKISVLRAEIDPDGRIRTSYNIAGTSTGRFSSSFSEFGTGGNLQNVEESLRSIFIADPGFKFAKFDAKSGESYVVGAIEWNLFRDPRFLDACESGDVHTSVARDVWPSLPWTGDIKLDKHIAERDFYRTYSHRFMCKKIGHGLNYMGGEDEISNQTRIPSPEILKFKRSYFTAFPAHELWHKHVIKEIQTTGTLTSLMGRRRRFWKRRYDKKTHKEAIAYDPQGSLADIVNGAMLNLWRQNIAILMFQDHDALTFMYPEHLEAEIVPKLHSLIVSTIDLEDGRELRIPYDCEVGWNKGKWHATKNPDGLKEFTGGDDRCRSPEVNLLDRIISRSHGKSRGPKNIPKVGGDFGNSSGNEPEDLGDDEFAAVPESVLSDNRPSWEREDEDVEGGEEISGGD